jgi:hypothetical protein
MPATPKDQDLANAKAQSAGGGSPPVQGEQHPVCSAGYEMKGPGHAFLSYVREDRLAVEQLQRVLEAAGIVVWRDTNLQPGEDWRSRIRQAITRDALAFIACFSANSASKEISYQNEELALAIDQLRLRKLGTAWLFPVRLNDCAIPDLNIGGGRTLASIQRADLFGEHREEGIARLVAAVLKTGNRSVGATPGRRPMEISERAPELLGVGDQLDRPVPPPAQRPVHAKPGETRQTDRLPRQRRQQHDLGA